MRDQAERYTEWRLGDMSARVRAVYAEALRDIKMKAASFEHAHKARVAKYKAKLEAGEITKEDYEAWMRGQMFQRKAWQDKQRQLEKILVDADRQAMKLINFGKLDVFAENANWMGFQLEKALEMSIGFGVYDTRTVARMLREDPNLLPIPEIDEERDYAWYNRIISNAITQGILQGENLGEIMDRVAYESGEKAEAAMLRNVRTAYTGAQNAGRLEGMRQSKRRGIHVKKRWMASLDDRTREAHADLDGQSVEVDEPFHSQLGDIMYPGDPMADPANVYNCRCTLVYEHPDYPSQIERREGENEERVGALTYKQWRASKAKG